MRERDLISLKQLTVRETKLSVWLGYSVVSVTEACQQCAIAAEWGKGTSEIITEIQ